MNDRSDIKPFFILGSPRSGTSLLSRMLDSHEQLVVPQESLIFKMFSSWLKYYGDLSKRANQKALLRDILKTRVIRYWSPTPQFDEVAPLISKPGFCGVVEALIQSTAKQKPIKLWGEKSPGHVFYWPQIKAEFPEAKVIHIIRDGRDVAVSLLKARMGPKTYYAAARLWCAYMEGMERVTQSCAPENYAEIHYERLLSDPETNLRIICDTLGVNYSDSMLMFYTHREHYATDEVNRRNLQSPIIVSNQEKWRKEMTINDIQEFETIAAHHLKKYGYLPVNTLGPLPRHKQLFIHWALSPAVRFIARAKDTKGQKEFINLQCIRLHRLLNYYCGIKS